MRFIPMAAVAVFCSAGFAIAQTSTPAPAGDNSAQVPGQTAPGMSSGKTPPSSSPTDSSSMMSPGGALGGTVSSSPAPTNSVPAGQQQVGPASPGNSGSTAAQ
jgi:hypothetical protein